MQNLEWEEVKSDGYADGNRSCLGRCRVEGGWVYEFSRWQPGGSSSSFGVFVPDNSTKLGGEHG